jgi:protein MpaA
MPARIIALLCAALALSGCARKWDYGEYPPAIAAAGPVVRAAQSPPPPPPEPAQAPAALRTPAQREVLLGYSVQDRPINMYVFGEGGEATLVFAAIHGNEVNSAALAKLLLEHLRANPPLGPGTLAVIPVANPDGLAALTRANASGVDVNRNFPARNWAPSTPGGYSGGPAAASEPETRALLNAMDQLSPRRIVSIHSIDGGRQCNNYDGPARELAELMKTHNGYPVKGSIGYPTPGSFGSYAGIDKAIATVTLELPHAAMSADAMAANRRALVAMLEAAAVGK